MTDRELLFYIVGILRSPPIGNVKQCVYGMEEINEILRLISINLPELIK